MPIVRSAHHVCTEGNRLDKSIGGCVVVHKHVESNHVEPDHLRTTTRYKYALSLLCNIHANNGAYAIAEMQQLRTRWNCSTLLFGLFVYSLFMLCAFHVLFSLCQYAHISDYNQRSYFREGMITHFSHPTDLHPVIIDSCYETQISHCTSQLI